MPDREKLVNLGGVMEGFPTLVPEGFNAEGDTTKDISVNDMFNSLGAGGSKGRPSIPISSFYTGNRHISAFPLTDVEEMSAQQQSTFDKWGNALTKMVGTAGTTFISGTGGLIYGVGASVRDGRFASLYDNEVTRNMDEFSKYLEDELPNYYTHQEKNADWYSPNNLFTANFWADKVLKNLGFSAGALAGGVAWGTLFRGIGLTNQLVKAGRTLELIEATEQVMTSVPKAQQFGALQSTLNSLAQTYLKTPTAAILKSSDRVLASVMGTFGEASLEALHNLNDFRGKLIEEYKAKYGVAPEGQDLAEINDYADKAGNFTWGANTLLLSATNYIMLPKILGSSRKADKALLNEITQDATGKFISPAKGFLAKTRGAGALLFSPTEAFEEGSQFAIQTGTREYFDRAYKNKEDVSEFFSNVSNVLGTISDEGIATTLSTKEGMENILIGGISGGLQQARGTVIQQGITGTTGQRQKNTDLAVSALNKSSLGVSLQDGAKYVARGINSQKLRQEAIADNDVLSEKDYELDFTMSYILPRVKYGKIDGIFEELERYENQAVTDQGFLELKNEGIIAPLETKEQFANRLNTIKNIAKDADTLYSQINDKYSNYVDKNGDKIFTDDIVDRMVYAAAKISDYDVRIPLTQQSLVLAGIDVQSILQGIIENDSPAKKPLKKAQQDIDKLNSIDEDQLKEDLRDVIELSLRRKKFVDEYNNIKRSPLSYKEAPVAPAETLTFTNVQEEVEPLQLDREYISPKREATVKKSPNEEEWEVNSPISAAQFFPTPEEANIRKAELDEELADIQAVKIIALNPDGTVAVEDVNGDRYNIPTSHLTGYEKTLTQQEKLQKYKQSLEEEQNDITKTSGTVGTNSLPEDIGALETEDKKKPTSVLFTSTTSASEDGAQLLKPHIIRTNTFLNNAKNFPNFANLRTILVTPNQEDSLGLKGLTDLSLEGSGVEKSKYTDFNEGLIAAVYVEQERDNIYFVDQEGKRINKINESTPLDKIIFSTMPTTHLVWADGKTARYRTGERDEAIQQAKGWEAKRKQLFNAAPGSYEIYEFSISRGIPSISDPNERYDVAASLIPEDKISTEQGLIIIPTTGTITFGEELFKFPNGRPVLHYRDTLQFIDNHSFTKNQAKSIFEVIKVLAEDIKGQQTRGEKKLKLNRKYTTFLQKVLWWKQTPDIKKNQIFIDPITAELFFGGDRYDLTNIADREEVLVNKLQETYSAVNNITLTQSFVEPFTEYYFENELKTRDWTNYQTYLLSSKLPDGTKRATNEVPLTTSVNPPSDAVPYNYKQKYAILRGMDFPEIPKPAPKQEVEISSDKIGEYVVDGITENTYKLTSGPVQFTAIVEGEGVSVSVIANETVDKIVGNDKTMNTIVSFLKSADKFDATTSDKEQALLFVGLKISNDLQKLKNAAPKTEKSLSALEAKKADIEKRRQTTSTTFNLERERKAGKDIYYEYYITPEGRTEAVYGQNEKVIRALINAKYDAELSALQSPTKVELVGEQLDDIEAEVNRRIKSFGITTPPANTEYRKAEQGLEGIARISPAEIELFKEWHAKNTPNISYEVTENILITHDNEKAWGAFENNVAKFYKSASRGTEYHETFEGIWGSFLTANEQQFILQDEKAKPGSFVDRQSGKKIKYDEATDLQIKERIADDFADFRLGKLPAKSLTDRVLRFFRAIINFFREFVSKPSLKKELFKAIDTGEFRDFTIPENLYLEPAYKRVEGLTEQQTNEFIQDISARFFQYVFGTNSSLYSPELLSSPEIFNNIKQQYLSKDKNNPDSVSRIDILGETAWNQLVVRTKDFLRTFKIEFDEDNILTINVEGQDNKLYAPEPFATNWKKSSPFPVKLLLGTLTETAPDNQESSNSMSLPAQKSSSVNGYKLLNFSRAFATVLDKLANTTKITSMVDKLIELAKFDSNYVRLFTRLKGDRNSLEIDFSKFQPEDWRLFINFYQTFTKQKPDAFIQYINNGEVYSSSANLATAVRTEQQSWTENMKGLSKKKDSLITYNKSTKTYQVGDTTKLPIKTPQNQTAFLSKIGIEFPMEVYNKLKTYQKKKFSDAVSAIYAYFGKEKDLMSVTGKTLKINGQLNTLAELLVIVTNPNQELSYFGLDGRRRQNFADNNAASILENDFNSSETLEQLLENRPELQDIFSQNSLVLKRGGLFFNAEGKRVKKIKVGYIQGTNNIDGGRETVTTNLSLGDRYVQELNQNVNGNYYILVPADSSTEWMMDLGNQVPFIDIESNDWSKIYTAFNGYLKDDIALAKQNRTYLRNTAPRAKELRFFKDILPQEILSKVNKLIKDDVSNDEIDIFLAENANDTNSAVKQYIENDRNNTIEVLKENTQIVQNEDETFSFKNLDDNFTKRENLKKYSLSQKEVEDIITFTNANYIINNVELHKILFGDPYQFAIKNNQLDETKRIKSFLSPRRTTFDSPEFNTFLNQQYNKAGEIQLSPTDPGYHLHKSHVNTVTLQDVVVAGSVSNIKDLPEDIKEAYLKTNEADAFSLIMDTTFREVKLKNGQWSEEAEDWHQWQMAYTRQNMPGYEYSNKALEKHDVALLSTPEPEYVSDVLKPIVSGNKHNATSINLALDKMSQMPVYYSAVEGTTLEKFYIKMWKEKKGYAVFESGRKVGAEELEPLYKEDGTFNDQPFNNNIQISWKSYGIQVENAYEGPKQQTRGSQLTKLSSLDLADNGVFTSEAAQKEYQRNRKLLDEIHKNGYRNLLSSLGIEDLDGSFRLVDNVSVAQTLQREMFRREASENMKDTLELDENGEFRIPFEASSAYIQIKDIIYSMVDKAIVAPKMSGGAHVQVPVTLWESSKEGRKVVEINGKKVFTDSTLKFYTKEDPYCEILLPAWFKDKINLKRFKKDEDILNYLNRTQEGKNILKGIGFRIPTQSMSSIEVFRVKGFLPSYMGNTVVVPSEITTKAGSDFDIDKLNMYLKAVYTDHNGDIKLVKYKGSEEETKEFYGKIFDRKLEKKRITKAEILEAIQIVHYGLEDNKGLIDKYADILNTIVQESENLADKEEELLQRIGQLEDDQIQGSFREDFVNEMYKRSLENEYYDSLEKLLTLPENFERLISPVDDAGLKKLSTTLDNLKGEDETSIKNRILNRDYMTSLRHAFVLGKKWVGIAAVNITGHSLTQKSEVFIDPDKFDLIPAFDRKFIADGEVVLPHNTTADGKISISGKFVKGTTKYISDRLSGYATSFVDVAKDPYILKLIKSDLAIGTFMFLERIGVGETTALFMNQPIIDEYLQYLDSINARGLYNKSNLDYIKNKFSSTSPLIRDVKINVFDFKDNIKKYAENKKLTEAENAVQLRVLAEFLKYAKMAQYSFKLTQASNYDTTRFRSADTLFKKQVRTEQARRSNIFSSVDKILDNSFIGEQSYILGFASEAVGEILKLDRYDVRSKALNPILEPYAENEFLSNDKYDRIANKVITSFIDFLVQTKGLNSEIKALLVDTATSVANSLSVAKQQFPQLRILRDLEIVSSDRPEGTKSLKLKANIKEAYDENLYTEMMRELRDFPSASVLYKDIVKLSLLQGTYNSPISIGNIIPLEDRAAIIAPIIQTLNADSEFNVFAQGAFQRNNWKDSDVFRKISPKFFTNDEQFLGEDAYGNEIYQYVSPAFAPLPTLGITASSRTILALNDKYHSFDIANDYLLVPRVVEDRKTGERVDMETGKTVTNAMFMQRKTKGDLSLKDVYGYKKVRHSDGSPVLTFDKEGNSVYIYKLINLWGDGIYASEYYFTNKPSVLNNGTVKITQEIPDADIINFFAPEIEQSITQDSNEQIPPCS